MSLTQAEWTRVEALLPEVLALPPALRAQFLERNCKNQPQVRTEIESLVAAAESGSDFFEHPVIVIAPSSVDGSLAAGSRLGPWRVLEPLGRGGMGEVYRAERADGTFTMQVAVKLLKRGLDSDAIARRFRRERRILAQLSHPNIARLLDAGVADDGRPYLVMEYVRGESITSYCESAGVPLPEILRLMCAICEAVDEAHRHLVVHRDLKPSNVLVTSEGQIKLLDFGIAKLLVEDDADTTGGTRDIVPLSPSYAAPEQILHGVISTATDVYALGVLLYLLLTGRLPHRREALPLTAVAMGLRDETTERPSAAVLSKPGEPAIDRKHRARELSGDLDVIVLKALQPEPARRYRSARELGEDLRRYLAHQPVLAQADSFAYRTRKFVRRHWIGLAAATTIVLLITLGVAGVLWQAQQTRTEARKATAVKDFLISIFQRNSLQDPEGAKARSITAEQLLATGAQHIRSAMQDQPEVHAELLGTIANLYDELDLPETAAPLYRDQVDILKQSHAGHVAAEVVEAEVALGTALSSAGHWEESDRILQQALQELDALGEHDSFARANALGLLAHNANHDKPADDPTKQQSLAEAIRIVAAKYPTHPLRISLLLEQGQEADFRDDEPAAEKSYREALRLLQSPPFAGDKADLASAYVNLGGTLRESQRFDEAEDALRRGLALYEELAGKDSSLTANAERELGGLLNDVGKRSEAVERYREALRIEENTHGAGDPDLVINTLLDFAQLQLRRGAIEEVAALLPLALERGQAAPISMNARTIALHAQARLLAAEGRLGEADLTEAQAEELVIKTHGDKNSAYAFVLVLQGNLALSHGKVAEATQIYQRVLSGWPASETELPLPYTQATWGLAQALLAQGQPDEAQRISQQLLDRLLALPQAPNLIDSEAGSRQWLGAALRRSGHAAQAESQLKRAVELREQLDDPASPWLAQARIELANDLIDLRKIPEARRQTALAAQALSQHAQLRSDWRESLAATQHRLAKPAPSGTS